MHNDSKIFESSICGNIVGLIQDGGGELVCCGKPMQELVANTEDAAQEKHVPVITVDGSTVRVAVGSVEHPMIEKPTSNGFICRQLMAVSAIS